MNDHHHRKHQQQQQRDRTGTVYYDAQSNFGTPPTTTTTTVDGASGAKRRESSEGGGAGDYKDYKMGIRKASGSSDRGPPGGDDVHYERVHTERRHHYSTSSSSPYPHRPPSREPHHQAPRQSTVIHHQIRSSPSTATPAVMMAPMSTSYDYSVGSSAFRAQSDELKMTPGSRWAPRSQEDFRPGPRASSAANIDALFAPKTGGGRMTGGYEPRENIVYTRREPAKDYGVVGAYSAATEQPLYGARQGSASRGSVRQHSNDYELDPRLNVTYPQFYVDDWKERHPSTPTSGAFPRAAPRQSPGGRQRFASDTATNRHLYEEVPMGGARGYGMKETAILDDYDNVPSEFLEENRGKMNHHQKEESKDDGGSAIYQPGRYQPC